VASTTNTRCCRVRFPQETVDRGKEMWTNGATITELAAFLGCPTGTVYEWKRYSGQADDWPRRQGLGGGCPTGRDAWPDSREATPEEHAFFISRRNAVRDSWSPEERASRRVGGHVPSSGRYAPKSSMQRRNGKAW
jgi:hypothetical protein